MIPLRFNYNILAVFDCQDILYQLGVNPPADIASGRIAEVRSRSMSCNCMTRTSQQECRGILEFRSFSLYTGQWLSKCGS